VPAKVDRFLQQSARMTGSSWLYDVILRSMPLTFFNIMILSNVYTNPDKMTTSLTSACPRCMPKARGPREKVASIHVTLAFSKKLISHLVSLPHSPGSYPAYIIDDNGPPCGSPESGEQVDVGSDDEATTSGSESG